jgi:hypothetical protein
MKQTNSIYHEIEKVNAIIEDCTAYLKKSAHHGTERIKSLLERAINLRKHYTEKLRRISAPSPSPDIANNLEYQVQERYGRLLGF